MVCYTCTSGLSPAHWGASWWYILELCEAADPSGMLTLSSWLSTVLPCQVCRQKYSQYAPGTAFGIIRGFALNLPFDQEHVKLAIFFILKCVALDFPSCFRSQQNTINFIVYLLKMFNAPLNMIEAFQKPLPDRESVCSLVEDYCGELESLEILRSPANFDERYIRVLQIAKKDLGVL